MTSVEFFGESFEFRPKVSQWALGKFARAAANQEQEQTPQSAMQGMVAMMDLIERCITVDDWPRFDAIADANDVDLPDLITVLQGAFQQETERPTGLPSDSSDGQTVIVPSSVVKPADKGLEHFAGRPDLQLAVQHSRSA
jgi:hypothetical protein